ncbi:short-subunit dehydrogenase [Stackebrandtia endophytica]|uniref:Short-subunit dehydrogenase n=1 Tax=Stackebrandtia endophytica TaxID=1496996 RepID=A0A543AQZ1_9ACTN|nr:SDR family NAD(P)-dependent oxidoreductase [Stackebrandtia endophytica]TQL74984.1 short-subunit dehydrogenase [Stackebrandtia endophytica]
MRITGSTVLITGASMGIGAATAAEFAHYGANVLLVARSADKLTSLAGEITRRGGIAHIHPADVATPEAVTELITEITDEHGTPDILVNNAGAGRFTYIDDTSPAEFHAMAAVPYLAAGYLTTAVAPAMIKRGSGHIVNVNSPVSRVVWPASAGYAASRWGLRGLTEGLRVDLAGTGVGVTEVIPGEVASEYFTNNPGSSQNIPKISRLMPRLTCQQVATRLVRAVACERREVVFPPLLRAMTTTARLAPRLVSRVVAATGTKRRNR